MAIMVSDRTTSRGTAVTVGYRRPCKIPRRKDVDVNDPKYAPHGRPLGKVVSIDVAVSPAPLPGYVVQDDGRKAGVKLPLRGYVANATVFAHQTTPLDGPVAPCHVDVPPCFRAPNARQRRANRRGNVVAHAAFAPMVPTVEVTAVEYAHLTRAYPALNMAIDIEATRERDGLFWGTRWGQRSAMVTRTPKGRRLTDGSDGGREIFRTGSRHVDWVDCMKDD